MRGLELGYFRYHPVVFEALDDGRKIIELEIPIENDLYRSLCQIVDDIKFLGVRHLVFQFQLSGNGWVSGSDIGNSGYSGFFVQFETSSNSGAHNRLVTSDGYTTAHAGALIDIRARSRLECQLGQDILYIIRHKGFQTLKFRLVRFLLHYRYFITDFFRIMGSELNIESVL